MRVHLCEHLYLSLSGLRPKERVLSMFVETRLSRGLDQRGILPEVVGETCLGRDVE